MLKPRIVIPIHWGSLHPLGMSGAAFLREPPETFLRLVRERAPEVEVRLLKPGESTSVSKVSRSPPAASRRAGPGHRRRPPRRRARRRASARPSPSLPQSTFSTSAKSTACPLAIVAPSLRMWSSEIPRSSAASPAPPARPTSAPATGTASASPSRRPIAPPLTMPFPGCEPVDLLELDAAVVVLDHDRRIAKNERVLVAELANVSERRLRQLRRVVCDGDQVRVRQLTRRRIRSHTGRAENIRR